MARTQPHRQANIWVARVIPVVLLGIFGYACWVVTRLVCLDYLLNPSTSDDVPRRSGAAIAIIVIFYLLLLPTLIVNARLIQTIATNPGYVPRGAQWHSKQAEGSNPKRHHHRRKRSHRVLEEKADLTATDKGPEYSSAVSAHGRSIFKDEGQPRVEDFWLKDVFVCNYDGRPPFCSTCLNFKPDRAHHCSELDRCVRKMDHFCPWVGGIVSETSFKLFIQFCFYAALFCIHTLVVMAYFFAERRRKTGFLDVNWVLIMAFAALFVLFSAGMFSSTFQLATINSTTVENLSRRTKVWYLAVYMARPEEVSRRIENNGGTALRTIRYPRPAEETQMLLQQGGEVPAATLPTSLSVQPADPRARTFAILESPQGFNPWDCGALGNIQEVMGYNVIDWFLPIKHSPCASHSSDESMFRLGPQVESLKEKAGLLPNRQDVADGHSSHRKKRRRRRSHRSPHRAEEDDSHAPTNDV